MQGLCDIMLARESTRTCLPGEALTMRIRLTIYVDDMARRAIALRNGHPDSLATREDLCQEFAATIDAHLQDLVYDGEVESLRMVADSARRQIEQARGCDGNRPKRLKRR